MINLRDMTVGDLWPFPKFRLWETVWSGGRFVQQEMDLSSDFATLTFFSRHEDNQEDLDDHSKDDVSGSLIVDGGGRCHYEWSSGDTDVVGRYVGRLYGTRTGGDPWHSKVWFQYYVVHKSRIGKTTS